MQKIWRTRSFHRFVFLQIHWGQQQGYMYELELYRIIGFKWDQLKDLGSEDLAALTRCFIWITWLVSRPAKWLLTTSSRSSLCWFATQLFSPIVSDSGFVGVGFGNCCACLNCTGSVNLELHRFASNVLMLAWDEVFAHCWMEMWIPRRHSHGVSIRFYICTACHPGRRLRLLQHVWSNSVQNMTKRRQVTGNEEHNKSFR